MKKSHFPLLVITVCILATVLCSCADDTVKVVLTERAVEKYNVTIYRCKTSDGITHLIGRSFLFKVGDTLIVKPSDLIQ